MNCTKQISMTGYLVRHVDLREPKPRTVHEGLYVMDKDALAALDRKYALLAEHMKEGPWVEVTWFREDDRKTGGEYVTSRGILTAVSAQGQWLELDREMRIRFGDIFALESPVFREE